MGKSSILDEMFLPSEKLSCGIAVLGDKYPEQGYSLNLESETLIIILEGKGQIVIEEKEFKVKEKDIVFIGKDKKYRIITDSLKFAVLNSPPWKETQYQIIKT